MSSTPEFTKKAVTFCWSLYFFYLISKKPSFIERSTDLQNGLIKVKHIGIVLLVQWLMEIPKIIIERDYVPKTGYITGKNDNLMRETNTKHNVN